MLKRLIILCLCVAPAAWAVDASDADNNPVEQWLEDPTRIFEAQEIDLDDFIWQARAIIVFADSSANPAFREQIELLTARSGELVERDVVVITDTDPAARSDLRIRFRPRGFVFAIVGKDGALKLRKPFPWDVREISRAIDKIPIRRQELRDR